MRRSLGKISSYHPIIIIFHELAGQGVGLFGFGWFVVICLGPGFYLMQQTSAAVIDPISTSIALETFI